ncbi:hypothetical protein Ancab_015520 [Ancistrocladus abbreviatus]
MRPVDRVKILRRRSEPASCNKRADQKGVITEYGSYRNNLSYKEALLGTRIEQHKNVVDEGKRQSKENVALLWKSQWTRNSLLGLMAVTPLGEKLVLLSSSDPKELTDLIELAKDWLPQLLEEVRSWQPEEVYAEQLVWIWCQEEEVWDFGKKLGISFDGDATEILQWLKDMDTRNQPEQKELVS